MGEIALENGFRNHPPLYKLSKVKEIKTNNLCNLQYKKQLMERDVHTSLSVYGHLKVMHWDILSSSLQNTIVIFLKLTKLKKSFIYVPLDEVIELNTLATKLHFLNIQHKCCNNHTFFRP